MSSVGPIGHYLIYEVQPGDSLSKIINNNFSEIRIPYRPRLDRDGLLKFIEIIVHNNPEINNPDLIFPGQILDLAPYKRRHFEIYGPADKVILRNFIRYSSRQELNALNRAQGTLEFIGENTKPTDWVGLGRSGILAATTDFVSQYRYAFERIQKSINDGNFVYKKGSNSLAKELAKALELGAVKQEINEMSKLILGRIKGFNYKEYLNPFSKTIVLPDHLNKKKTLAYLERAFQNIKYAKYIKAISGYGIDIALGVYKVVIEEGNKIKVTFEQTGGIIGGIAASAGGTYVVCTLALSLPSGGTSAFFCGAGVAFTFGAAGNWAGEQTGGYLYNTGETLYNSNLY